ncbi:MAG: 23S rRNA (guanosine(2251)-2'-O)-methyltransferase RlmB [Christensenellaceae bacterium]
MKIEGRNAVEELIKTETNVETVYVQNGLRDEPSRTLLNRIKSSGMKVTFLDKSVMDKQSVTHRHQGFIAVVSDYEYADFYDILNDLNEDSFIVVCDGIEDVHNLGSIIRVCECAKVDALIIGKHRSASVNETVMRISEGGANHIRIAKVTNINQAIEKLKEAGVWVYALEVGGDDIYKTNLKGKLCLVIGGEDTGVNRLTREKCDGVITIPMYGKINSLNASVATGIAVFEALRQRKS